MWILILYIYAGVLATGDSVAITNVPGFTSEQSCKLAGDKATDDLVNWSSKVAKFTCVKQ